MPDTTDDHANPLLADLPPGSFAFHYTLRTAPGRADEFLRAFHEWDHSDENIVHSTPGMVHEGVLYQSEDDPDLFYLIGIWNDRENHRRVVERVREMRPAWLDLLATPLVPQYLRIIG